MSEGSRAKKVPATITFGARIDIGSGHGVLQLLARGGYCIGQLPVDGLDGGRGNVMWDVGSSDLLLLTWRSSWRDRVGSHDIFFLEQLEWRN